MFKLNIYMNKCIKKIKKTAGFTLIELLVVIGILGILAAALVATIDPFEQLKKAQDANVKNAATEFVNASIRYYTTHNAMPWDDTVNAPGCGSTGVLTDASLGDCLDAMVQEGELKSAFTTADNLLKEINVTGNSNLVTTCFKPQSKSQQEDALTKYDSVGQTTTGCKSQTSGGGIDCYWCIQ